MDSVVLLSGGLDSLVVLAQECAAGHKPHCLTFAYHQLHEKQEVAAATVIARHYGVGHEFVSLPQLTGSALTGQGPLPLGLPADDQAQSATVVPGRNLLFIATAVARAVQLGRKRVFLGANAGDQAIYPDCRWSFVRALGSAMAEAYGVNLAVPLLHLPKGAVVALGRRLNAPLETSWSCYQGGEVACGQCGACMARKGAGA